MTEEKSKKVTPEMIAQAAKPKITEAEGELVAVDPDHKTESTHETEAAQKEAEEDLKNNAKSKVEDAICQILSENICDYKDFHFPINKMDVLLYRMHHEINGRIQAFTEENMEVEDIVSAYRDRYSKADDIEYIIKTYKAMDLDSDCVPVLPNPANTANAGPPIVVPSSSTRPFLPAEVLFEPIGSQAAGLEPREREKEAAQKEAEEDLKNNAESKVEDAKCQISSENTCDFKDFQFPTNKRDVLFYRMHCEINGRIQAFKEENKEVKDIASAYRARYSKADEIKYIINTYKAMDLESDCVPVLPNPANTANAGPPIVVPSSSTRPFLPAEVLFEPIGSQAAGLEPREREKEAAQKEAEEDLKNNAESKVEDAKCQMLSENTCDFKDFQFPTNKRDVLFYRMHCEINGRIQAFKEENKEVKDIASAYRARYSKADEIKYIINTYKAMDLESDCVPVLPNPANTANAGPPIVVPSSSTRPFLPAEVLFEPIGSQAAGLEPRERTQLRRRSVRFQSPQDRECRQEDETKEKE